MVHDTSTHRWNTTSIICASCARSTLDLAEATSYRAAIRTARGFVKDVGEAAASSSGGITALSRIREDHSERDGQKLMSKLHLGIPIPLTPIKKSPGVRYTGEFCMLRIKDWLTFMIKMNCFHILCGLARPDVQREQLILIEFWRRYKQIFPDHSLWELIERNNIDVSRLAPMILHGDEGRGRRRTGFLVMSWHSYLGLGTQLANSLRKAKPYLSFKLNYIGSAHATRFLTGAMPKMLRDHIAFEDLQDAITEDILEMTLTGVQDRQGITFRLACLQVCGDWQFLQKCGHLVGTYSNVEKRPRAISSIPKGICHKCQAGQLQVPFEDFRFVAVEPEWRKTMYQQNPFKPGNLPPILKVPHVPTRSPSLFAFDVFHCYHLGVGKTFFGACLALMSEEMHGSNIDSRFEELTHEWLAWCDSNRKSPALTVLSKEGIAWADKGQYPNGQWSKGHITSMVGQFVQHWLDQRDISHSPLLQECKQAVAFIDRCMHLMYSSDVFLSNADAKEVWSTGLGFLASYQRLAVMSYKQGRNLFSYMPKAHALAELWWDLKDQSEHGSSEFSMNPLIYACQIDEDYIGRTSRLARRVSATQSVRRTIERSLQASFKHWVDSGYLRS